MWVRIFGACALAMGFASQTIVAQESPFRFSMNTSVSVTDNRDSLADGLEEDNTDFKIGPRIDYNVENDEQSRFNFFYAPGYRYRTDPARTQNETEWHHDLGLFVDHALTRRLSISIQEIYNFTDDPAISEAGTQIRQSGTFQMNRLTLGAIYALTQRSTMRFRVHNRFKEYDEEVNSTRSDEDVTEASLAYWYELDETSAILAQIGINQTDYDTDLDFDRGFEGLFYGIGYEKLYTDRLSVSARLGFRDIEYDDSDLADSDYPYANVGGRLDVAEGVRLFGKVEIGEREPDVFPFASQEYTGLNVELHKDFTERLTAEIAGYWRTGSYDRDAAPADLPDSAFNGAREGDEDTALYRGSLRYKINNTYTLLLQHLFEDVDSDVDTSFQRNDTLLSLDMSFH